MSSSIATWLVQQRFILFILSLILISLFSAGFSQLQVRTDYKVFFDADNPQLIANERIEDNFSPSDSIILIINPASGNVFTQSTLAAITDLTTFCWQIPYSQRVDSLTNFQYTFVDGDDLRVEDLIQKATELSEQDIQKLRSLALNEPLIKNRLISTSGHVSAIIIELNLPDNQTIAQPQVMESARQIRDQFVRQHPDIEVLITGLLPLNHAFTEMTEQDAISLTPLMLLVILTLLGILLRSISSVFTTLLVLLGSVFASIGTAGWLGIPLNNINSVSPIIILTLAVADCVHILSHFLHAMNKGNNKINAMEESLTVNLKPVFLTSITTAIGFLSMLSSDSPPFRELGVISAIGVLFAFIFSLTLLPQLAIWLTRKIPEFKPERTHLFLALSHFTTRRPLLLFLGMLALALSCMAFITQNELNDDNFGYFSKRIEVRRAADFAEANINGVNLIEYVLESGEDNGINDPRFLEKVDGFVQWMRTQSYVTHVFTFTDTLKRLNRNLHADDPTYYRLPDSRELAAQYGLLYEMSLPFGMDLNNQINLNRSALRIGVSIKDAKANDIIELDKRAQTWFQAQAPKLTSLGSGPSVMFSHIGSDNIHSMIQGTVLATLIISGILIISLGSWKLGLLSLIPNAFPAAIMLGIWGYCVGEVNLAVAVVFGITLGIVVDDTVHFLSKFIHSYHHNNQQVKPAIDYAFEHVGPALLTTTLVLAIGFGMLTLSDFNVNAILGIMVAMTISIALIFDFLFLPPLLMLLGNHLKTKASGKPTA